MATGRIALLKDIVVVMCSLQLRLRTVENLVLHAKWSVTIALPRLLVLKNAGLKTVMMLQPNSKRIEKLP